MTTVADALAAARGLGLDRLDAQLLLTHHLGKPRSWLLAHADALLPPDVGQRFDSDCVRRASGMPLAYVLARWTFRGLALDINPAVLVPRPETEVLVEWALALLATDLSTREAPELVDLGTGSGAIALAVAHECRRACVAAVDASEGALEVARTNGRALGLTIEWLQGHWWKPLEGRRFDLVLSNPPYVALDDPHLRDLSHEPSMALTSGPDGLAALREIVAGAPAHLLDGAWLLLEHGHDQGDAVRAMLLEQGFEDVQTRPDLAGLPRCTGARRPRR